MRVSCGGRVGRAGSCPAVRVGIISAAGVKLSDVSSSAPDDHLAAVPHCHVKFSAIGRAGRAGGYPAIGNGVISAAGVRKAAVKSAPDDHFGCRSTLPCETLEPAGALVVLMAVQLSVLGLYLPPVFRKLELEQSGLHTSAPDDHFTAGPDCRVVVRHRARLWCWWLSMCHRCNQRRVLRYCGKRVVGV